jgi:hypothetical protein
MTSEPFTYRATCRCGEVELEANGPHVVHISCYCDDCQAAAAIIDAMSGGWSGVEDDGGTRNVLFRRDRLRFVRGMDELEEFRVREDSHTVRLVANCCNTAMAQRHDHWWPHRGVKTDRLVTPAPPLEMRVFTRHAPGTAAIPKDVPAARGIPLRLGIRLMLAVLALHGRPPNHP